jgi:RimJ/RimL family protein N-acetyltransferase
MRETRIMWKQASSEIPKLETTRLVLRSMRPQDSQAFFDIHSDEETLRYWSGDPISEFSEAEALLQKELDWAGSGECINWGIALPDSNTLIGKFTLFQYSEQNCRAEVGYLLDRRHWGRGYMTEVLGRVLQYSFDVLELHRLEADSDPLNTASLALLESAGFQREGYFRERWFVQGKWLDSVMLGLLREDYLEKMKTQQT